MVDSTGRYPVRKMKKIINIIPKFKNMVKEVNDHLCCIKLVRVRFYTPRFDWSYNMSH